MSVLKRRAQRGFTLIEIMITVLVVAILASIAYPTYQNAIRKSNRSAAQSFMMELAQKEQAYLADSRVYTANYGTDLGLTLPAKVSQYYGIEVTVGAKPPVFMITATPTGTQVPDGSLTLSHTGARTPVDKW